MLLIIIESMPIKTRKILFVLEGKLENNLFENLTKIVFKNSIEIIPIFLTVKNNIYTFFQF